MNITQKHMVKWSWHTSLIQSMDAWNIPIKRTQYIDAISGKPINSINNIITHKSKGKGQSNFYG